MADEQQPDRPETVEDVKNMLRQSTAEPQAEPTPSQTEAGTQPLAAPFPGYDNLTAAEVVERLPSMTAQERQAVLNYERANRNRKTIVEALENWTA